jgi:hypothetical protein
VIKEIKKISSRYDFDQYFRSGRTRIDSCKQSLVDKNRKIYQQMAVINRSVDGAARRCSTILQYKARTVDGKKEKGCVTIYF